jgi:hypothetical protein
MEDQGQVIVRLSLRVHGDALDPEAVTHALGCAPKTAARKGEHFSEGSRFRAPAPTGTWYRMFRLEPTAEGAWLRPSLRDLGPTLVEALAGLRAKVDVSLLVIGGEEEANVFLRESAGDIAAFAAGQGPDVAVRIHVPSTGVDVEVPSHRLLTDAELLDRLSPGPL